MSRDGSELIAGELHRPRPVEGGALRDVDVGVPGTVVLTVERDGEVYYETYALVRVESRTELRE